MSKIDLSDVNSGYNRSAINSNFQRIKDFLNDRVLMRNNVSGEPNTVLTDIDFNGKRLYNLPAPSTNSEPARLQDLSDVVASGAVLATSTNDGLLSKTGFTKLAGIDDNATRNSTDIALLSRTNHTGFQAISTVTGLQTALDSKVGTSGDVAITGNVTGATFGATSAISSAATSGAFKYGILSYSDTNIFASYKTTVNSYSQIVAQNSSNGATASVDFVVSNDLGTATTYCGNIGMNSSGFTGTGSFNAPNVVYISSTSSDLVLGTTTANAIKFVTNGAATDAGVIASNGATTWNNQFNFAAPVTVASAASVAIGAAASNNITISGTTTITAFDTIAAGAVRFVTFSGALTLTHNATSLILPGGANIVTAAGDFAHFVSLGAGNWRCTNYTAAAGVNTMTSAQLKAALTDETGSGANVFATSPVLVTPNIGAATASGALNLTSGQITFPATQIPSANVNCLDDYEEGSWTPTQGGGLTVVGSFSSGGTYVKLGKQVTVTGSVSGSTSVASSTGTVLCGGLPFSVAGNGMGAVINASYTTAGGCLSSASSLYSNIAMPATSSIYFTCTYFV